MRDAVARAVLPAATTLYCLRHTHASLALLAGMNLQLLAENLGTSILMIEHNYGKFTSKARERLVEEFGPKLGLAPGNVRTLKPKRGSDAS
jgi:hypothetical protein